jgi:regulator of sigma E protease
MSLSSIVLFIIILLALVIVHELGHFLAAKALGVKVDEFAFGFPPKKWGETEYIFNALPLGGYVKIHGEDGGAELAKDKRALLSKKWWEQIFVLVAGVAMNMIFAFIILIILAMGTTEVGENDVLYAQATQKKLIVVDSITDSPGYKAGIRIDDEIVAMTAGEEKLANLTTKDAIAFIAKHQDGVAVTFQNEKGVRNTATVAPVYGIAKDKKVIGIGLATFGEVHLTFLQGIIKGAGDMVNMSILVAQGFATLIKTLVAGKSVSDQVAGPIGIAKVVHKAKEIGYSHVAYLAAILSINLAFFNILPFPALDGGRTAVILGETLFRRKLSRNFFTKMNTAGFLFLMLLFVLVTGREILALFIK